MKQMLICAGFCVVWSMLSPSTQNIEIIPPSEPIPTSFFGTHIHHLVSPDGKNPLTRWPAVNVPEWRLWDARVTWPDLEPKKGEWRFNVLDKSIEMAEVHHTEVMLTLGFTPAWASARPEERVGYNLGWAAEPKDIADWRNFIQTVARRYKGRVRIYEIWNEPNLKNHYWTGSVEQMVALVHAAHDIIKDIDPGAIVVSPSATSESGISWLSEFLSKGGNQYVDVIGYHFYVNPSHPESLIGFVEKIRQVMRANGVEARPLWDTESGWMTHETIPEDLGAAYLARSYILHWAEGIRRFYWYAWDNNKFSVEALRPDGDLTAAGESFGTIQDWLVDARMDWCRQDPIHTWMCQIERRGSKGWLVWNPDGTRPFVPPGSWHIHTVLPLIGVAHGLDANDSVVGPIPQLLTQAGVTNGSAFVSK
jgi:Glycosyl hydrolases family 39